MHLTYLMMMLRTSHINIFVSIAFFVSHVFAFGSSGHRLIGEAVWSTLNNNTQRNMIDCGFLEPFDGNMGTASVWADLIKRNVKYRWTSPFHYYDIDGDPPNFCGRFVPPPSNRSLNLFNGVKRALANYTSCVHRSSETPCCGSTFHNGMLIHMIQDLHQPLHLTGKSRGGNDEWFTKDGKKYNLHKFWDTEIVNMLQQDLPGDLLHKDIVARANERLATEQCPASEDTLLHYIFAKAQDILNVNCEVIWKTDVEDYIIVAKNRLYDLLVDSIVTSHCVFTCLYERN